MKKRWSVWLSIFVLIVNLIPNIWQGYTVLADSFETKETKLINQEDLGVTSNVTASQENNVWEIHYRYQAAQDNEKRRLKFKIFDNQNNPILVNPEKGWTLTETKELVSPFSASDTGSIQFTTARSISNVKIKIQADAQFDDKTIKEDILPEDIGKFYELTVSEDGKTSILSENSNDSSTEPSSVTKSSTENPNVSDSKSTVIAESNETTTEENDDSPSLLVGQSNVSEQVAPFAAINYTNITPQYTTNSSGTYPTTSWTPTGNQTVINHQGKTYGSVNWDGNTGWSGNPDDVKNSYIEYGGKGSDAEFAIRKYAKETNTPGLYDVYLNVRGNKQKDIKPVDIVLVVDMSGSMEPSESNNYNDRAGAIRTGVSQFLKSIKDAGIDNYINVGLVGFSSPGEYVTGANGYIEVPMQSVAKDGHVDDINKMLSPKFSGGTFTQLGTRQGSKMLQADTSGNQKMMILLTDGVPTFSYVVSSATTVGGTLYGTSFSNNLDQPGFTSQLWRNVNNNRTPTSYNVGGNTIRDTWPATLGEAKMIKDSGIELHALGIQLGKDSGYTNNSADTYLTLQQVRARMGLLASPGLYQDASTTQDVQNYLESKAKNVVSEFNSINNGSIIDPIGSQFIYNSTKAEVRSVGSTPVTNLPTSTITNNQLNVSGLNLGKDQEIQLHYQMRLNTETSDFVPNKWYQMNGETTLMPNDKNPDNKVNFGVPSAKGEGIQLDFKKIWEEYDNDKSQRPSSVTYEVTRSQTTIANVWKTGFIKVEGSQDQDTWAKSTNQLASVQNGDANLWLPKYNAQGVNFNYKISNEIKVDGYDGTQVDDTTFKNIKQFIPLRLDVMKEDGSGKKISGASFKLVDESGMEISGIADSEGSTFTFNNLKAGKYTLTEVKAPDGYVILKHPIQIEVLKDGSVEVDNKSVKVENHTIKLIVDNQKKGLLPSTGGSGRTGYWIMSSIFIVLMAILGGYYWYRNRKASKKRNLEKSNRVLLHLSAVLIILSTGASLLRPVKAVADTNPVTFILHKRVFKDSEQLKSVQNNGLVVDDNDADAKDLIDENLTYGLNDVTFSVYDATQYVTDNLGKMSQEDLLKKVTNTDNAKLLSEIAPYNTLIQEVVTKNVNGEDGVAELTVNPSSESSAYLLIETKLSPAIKDKVEMTATPMLVILPIENPTKKGTYLNTINLYPKNTAIKPVTPTSPPSPPIKPDLPQTGEAKTIMGVFGLVVILTAVLLWQKKK